jgi:hypothetical protein
VPSGKDNDAGTLAILARSFLSYVVGARPLLILTGIVVLGFGIQALFFPENLSLKNPAVKLER